MFEDSHIGIASAKKAGFFTVGLYDAASAEHWDTLKYHSDLACRSLRQAYYAFKNAYSGSEPYLFFLFRIQAKYSSSPSLNLATSASV